MTSIALCITDLNVGGAERCLAELAVRLDRRRFSPTVYCLAPPPGPGESNLIPYLTSAGVEVECLGARRASDFPGIVLHLGRMLRQRKTQLVQTFLFHANLVGRMAAWWVGVPNVVCGIRVAEREADWRLWLDRKTQRLANYYVCVSNAVAEFSATAGRLPREKLIVIPNGIDMTRFDAVRPADLSEFIPAGRRLITFVGRLDHQKSIPQLLVAASKWFDRTPDCDLLVVGAGPQLVELQQQCRELRIADRVHFAGWRADIPGILAASSLLVLASAWEGMPNVVLEAMASGLAVAVTRVEGIDELLGPTVREQSVTYGDWDAFSGMVVRRMDDRRRSEELGLENHRRAASCFSIESMVTAYQNVWESLLTGSQENPKNLF
jgi:glycosyltransferase involved in cell wall biosynthesis